MKLMALVIALATLGTAAFADENLFTSPTAGFELTKPPSWVYMSADQNADNLRRTDHNDPELKAALMKYATAPMVVITKHPEPFDDLNPSFKVNMRPLGQFAGASPETILSAMLPPMKRMFSDLTIVQEPVAMSVGGLPGAHARFNYTLRAGGVSYPATSELWVVPRGDFFFLMGAGWREDEATGSRSEISSIVESIRITP